MAWAGGSADKTYWFGGRCGESQGGSISDPAVRISESSPERGHCKSWHTVVDGEEDTWSAPWAGVDGVVRAVRDVAVRGVARTLATEGQISAVAAAMLCQDPASVSMWACLRDGFTWRGSYHIGGSTHGQQSRLKGHDALRERGLRDEDKSVDQYRMLVDKVRESIWVGW